MRRVSQRRVSEVRSREQQRAQHASPLVEEQVLKLRSLLVKPGKLRTYDEVLELMKHVKDMDFITSHLAGTSLEYATGHAQGGVGTILRHLSTLCGGMTIQTIEKNTVIYDHDDPATVSVWRPSRLPRPTRNIATSKS